MKDNKIIVENINKKFIIRDKGVFGSNIKKEILALSDISFKVKSGEILGIIGNNGSGKSTLLKMIAGIYQIGEGNLKTSGSIVYLSGFGHVIKRGLTMGENIYFVSSLMGLNNINISKKFKDIVEFSGLEEYLDVRVKYFSSGMIRRLNFSIGIYCLTHNDPDILLVDEAISAGGDILFKKKAFEKITNLISGGASVLLVSHSLQSIMQYCDRVIWLGNGKIIMDGEPKKVVNEYRKKNQSM